MASTLERAYPGGANALNFLRLVLASMVIFGHAAVLSGVALPSSLALLLSEVPVDGFFAISGFLIARSWHRNPQARGYLMNRVLRIGPAFVVCLVVTAVLIAPLATATSGRSMQGYWTAPDGPVPYVWKNITLWMGQYQISGGPTGIPYPLTWDGSLWTLGWEFLCYLGLACAGALGILSVRPALLPWLFVGVWIVSLFGVYAHASGRFASITRHIEPIDRFALMFIAGTMLFAFAERCCRCIPLWRLSAASSC